MKKRRGSAMLLCLLLAIAATSAVLTMTSLATNCAKEQTRREYDLKVKMSIEGVLTKVEQSFGNDSINLGVGTTITCGGFTWAVTTVDNSAAKPKSYQVTLTGNVGGATYTRKYVIGNPYARSTFKYAMARNTNFTLMNNFLTGPALKGDVFVDGTILTGLLGTIDGDYYTTALIPPIGLTVKGKTVLNAKPLTFPAINKLTYQAAADLTVPGGAGTVTNWTFGSPNQVVYVGGDLHLQGTITGTGTIVVDNDLHIEGNLSYGDASSLVVFLVTHDFRAVNPISSIVGHYYAAHDATIDTGLTAATLAGSVTGIHALNVSSNLTLIFDPRIKDNQLLGYRLKLPGYWP